jgi:tetratricopeptide (TPR) repeat protein
MDEKNGKYRDQIEDYLLGKLDQAQREALERAMQQDEALRQELEAEEKIIKGFRQLRFEKMGSIIDGWEEEIIVGQAVPEDGKVIHLGRRAWWGIAAALALLITGLWWLMNRDAPDQAYYQAIALAQYERPDLRSTAITKSTASNADSLFGEAYRYFSAQAWEEAESALRGIADTSAYYRGANALKGLAHLEQGEYEAAIDAFRLARQAPGYYNLILTDAPMRVFSDADIDWYTAIAFLGLGQGKDSKRLLEALAGQADYPQLQSRARALLEQL